MSDVQKRQMEFLVAKFGDICSKGESDFGQTDRAYHKKINTADVQPCSHSSKPAQSANPSAQGGQPAGRGNGATGDNPKVTLSLGITDSPCKEMSRPVSV